MAKLQLVGIESSAFFDKRAVLRAIGRKKASALSAVGREIRYRARGSMALAPHGEASAAPRPPHRHRKSKRNKGGGGFWRSIVYGYDRASGAVVIGPSTRFGGGIRQIATRSEYGGHGHYRNPRRRQRRVGGAGEIRLERHKRRRWKTAKRAKDTLLGPTVVVYAKLHTADQARRANELNTALYGASRIPATWPQRPVMGPALESTRPEIPRILTGIWALS